jgi:hypothetical protein
LHQPKAAIPKDLVPVFEEKINNDRYLQRLFQECGAGLPTTCGYQFLWNGEATDLSPSQYFSCDGLGFAVEIQEPRQVRRKETRPEHATLVVSVEGGILVTVSSMDFVK